MQGMTHLTSIWLGLGWNLTSWGLVKFAGPKGGRAKAPSPTLQFEWLSQAQREQSPCAPGVHSHDSTHEPTPHEQK